MFSAKKKVRAAQMEGWPHCTWRRFWSALCGEAQGHKLVGGNLVPVLFVNAPPALPESTYDLRTLGKSQFGAAKFDGTYGGQTNCLSTTAELYLHKCVRHEAGARPPGRSFQFTSAAETSISASMRSRTSCGERLNVALMIRTLMLNHRSAISCTDSPLTVTHRT